MRRVVVLIVLAALGLGGLAGCGDKAGGVTKTDTGVRQNRVPAPPGQPRE
jgi:hypothetical protein